MSIVFGELFRCVMGHGFIKLNINFRLPLFFIVPWITVRALLEDSLCWTTNENSGYFWIIRAPVTTTIIVNFLFFVNITRVLFLKMFVSLTTQANRYRYRKWFRSTLVLVPLFGVHYAVLLGMSFSAGVNRTAELIWLYADILFSSFQGFFVALLYCFCNGEVQQELRKLWKHCWVTKNHSIRSHHSILTQSLTYFSRGRNSIQSLHSSSAPVDRRDNNQGTTPSPRIPHQDNRCEGLTLKPTPHTPTFIHSSKGDQAPCHSNLEVTYPGYSKRSLTSELESLKLSTGDGKQEKSRLLNFGKYEPPCQQESSL
ncbi:glucagon receptor-like [Tachypleus tridentatus]|uniref:glucagon receptor-like n=1 Tax=Tachypleus tridentatus TaxID=6853 RepID=UPI003FD41939